jgi:phospholipid/cholesterol/gamma-HCH transport system substrate-binding protein
MNKYAHETLVGIFVIIGLVGLGYMAVTLGNVSLLGDDSYVLFARFTSVSGLHVGNSVEMLGLEIGRVSGLTMDQDKRQAVVELKVNHDIQIFDDAIASIKTAGLIGNKYVSIDAGGAGERLQPGQTIRDTQPPIDIGELIGKYVFGSVANE